MNVHIPDKEGIMKKKNLFLIAIALLVVVASVSLICEKKNNFEKVCDQIIMNEQEICNESEDNNNLILLKKKVVKENNSEYRTYLSTQLEQLNESCI